MPLHKKKASFDAENYRGVHLTPVLTKVLEKVLGQILQPYFVSVGAYGSSQWAFQKKIGASDLVAETVMSCLLACQQNRKNAIYLSDISGAFDRVETELLLEKLKATGLSKCFISFLRAYLAPRDGVVLADGETSHQISLRDMIFQGTVLGPSFWNVFFRDVGSACFFVITC